MRHWMIAVVFGGISTAAIVVIQVVPTPEAGFAGAAFGYNVSFFFPMVLASLAFWIPAVVFYVLFIRHHSHRTALRIGLPLLLLLACPYQLTVIGIGLYQLNHLPPPPA